VNENENEPILQFRLTKNSQWYLVNAKPDTNHSTNPTNPTNPTYPTNPTDPTNPTTKYRCEFVNLNCKIAENEPLQMGGNMIENDIPAYPYFQHTSCRLTMIV